MRGESPRFKRCCFCIPLRRGLLGWGYLILALNLLKIILLTILNIADIMSISLPSIILLIMDVTFSVLLIVACHKKSPKLLKIYFIYGVADIILLLASTLLFSSIEIVNAVRIWGDASDEGLREVVISLVATPAICFVEIFVYTYVLFLVRSERMKLREQNLEMQFVNNEAEAEASCVCVDYATCTNDGHDDSSALTTTDTASTPAQYVNGGETD